MNSTIWITVGVAGVLLLAGVVFARSANGGNDPDPEPADPYVLDHIVKDIDDKEIDLRSFEGRVVMIVNVASKCGLTPQYEQLQALHDEFYEQGFVVIGFPANNFMGQEPGTNGDIAEFCSTTYGVEFPMMAKVSVKGEDRAELFSDLSAQAEPLGGDPKWNFTKYLLNRRGEVVARFGPRTKPDDEKVRLKVRELLQDNELRDGVEPWTPPSE